ncbi:hypothetical protein OROGR_027862 [Orobanche gracilis]
MTPPQFQTHANWPGDRPHFGEGASGSGAGAGAAHDDDDDDIVDDEDRDEAAANAFIDSLGEEDAGV